MIVYVETNFIFELGFGRQEAEHCRLLLEWCKTGRIEVRLPAYALAESRRALRKRDASRLDAFRVLKTQSDDAKRHSAADAPILDLAQQTLRLWTDREAVQLNDLIRLLLYGPVKLLPLDSESLGNDEVFRAVKVLSGDGDLLIFASIMRDLVLRQSAGDVRPSCFVTMDAEFRSAKTFLKPYSCDLLTSYSAAVARLKGQFA